MAHNPGIEILLTRPALQSAAYARELRALLNDDIPILQSPLLRIQTLEVDIDLSNVHHLLFTSVNGVKAFAERSDQRAIPAICVGKRTAEAARAIGLSAVSAKGSAKELVKLAIETGQGLTGDFLYVRGVHVAGNISREIRSAKLVLREAVVYDQSVLTLHKQAIAALSGENTVVLPLFSPRTARLLSQQIKAHVLQHVIVICISSNVADQLEAAKFSNVIIAKQASAAAVTAILTREIAASV